MRPIYLISKTPYPGVIHIPILSIHFLTPQIDFSKYAGVILTSKQAILALKPYTVDWKRLKCICVSEATAEYARESGAIDIETGDGYGKSIPDILSSQESGKKWIYLRPKIVASDWIEEGRKRGLMIDEAVVYETLCNQEAVDYRIEEEGVLIFTSPSSIRCFSQNYPILPTQKVVVIGKTTQNALPQGVASSLSPTASVAVAVDLAHQIASLDENSSPF